MTKSRDLGNLAQTVAVNLPTSLGTAGQTLMVNSGADGLEFGEASSGSGVIVYTGLSGTDDTPSGATYLLNASSPSAGDLAYVTANTSLYQSNGNGWYRIAVINTTPTISSVADASSNTTPFDLVGGTNTVITVTASDAEEGTDLAYSYSVTSGSLNGTTVTQGTGASENVFTIASHASNATTFSLTFTVSDNINAATSVAEFTLEFAFGKHTTLLMATDNSYGDNDNFTDSSTNNQTLTAYNGPYAGTFSPYRQGGYSAYFDGSGDYLTTGGTGVGNFGTGDFTVEFWMKTTAGQSTATNIINSAATGTGNWGIILQSNKLRWNDAYAVTNLWEVDVTNELDDNWHHIAIVRSSGTQSVYVDGVSKSASSGTFTDSADYTAAGAYRIGLGNGNNYSGYLTDVRIVKGSVITPPSGGPSSRLTDVTGTSLLTCHLPYFADGSSDARTITISGNPETRDRKSVV